MLYHVSHYEFKDMDNREYDLERHLKKMFWKYIRTLILILIYNLYTNRAAVAITTHVVKFLQHVIPDILKWQFV